MFLLRLRLYPLILGSCTVAASRAPMIAAGASWFSRRYEVSSGDALRASHHEGLTLRQPQFTIPIRRDFVAAGAIGGRAAAIARDDAGGFAFDIAVDAGHPGIDLVRQQADAERLDMIGPGRDTLRCRFQPRQLMIARVVDEPRHPVDAIFDAARNIAE